MYQGFTKKKTGNRDVRILAMVPNENVVEYVARNPHMVNSVIKMLQEGASRKMFPPKIVMDKTIRKLKKVIRTIKSERLRESLMTLMEFLQSPPYITMSRRRKLGLAYLPGGDQILNHLLEVYDLEEVPDLQKLQKALKNAIPKDDMELPSETASMLRDISSIHCQTPFNQSIVRDRIKSMPQVKLLYGDDVKVEFWQEDEAHDQPHVAIYRKDDFEARKTDLIMLNPHACSEEKTLTRAIQTILEGGSSAQLKLTRMVGDLVVNVYGGSALDFANVYRASPALKRLSDVNLRAELLRILSFPLSSFA